MYIGIKQGEKKDKNVKFSLGFSKQLVLLDPQLWPEGSYELGSVLPPFQKFSQS